MLAALSIKNYALIDDLNVDFKKGLTIITGETGAGKSILLGGISLVLGKRADLSSIKDVSKKSIIEAVFDISNYNLKSIFEKHDLDYEKETIIRREILPSGKSRAFINDTPVNLNALTEIGLQLIDIHSQHQNLELTNDDFQFQIIDALADTLNDVSKYKHILNTYKNCKQELNKLKALKSETLKEHDYNAFLLLELNEAKLVSGELEVLEAEYEKLNNIEDIQAELQLSNQLINEDQIGILTSLSTLKNSLEKLSNISNTYSELYNRVHSVLVEIDDLTSEIDHAQELLHSDPKRLDEVNGKLQTVQNLLQKHAVLSVDELLEIQKKLSEKVLITAHIDDDIQNKENALNTIQSNLDQLAGAINAKRNKVLPELIKQLQDTLSDLGMQHSRFNISVELVDDYFFNGKDKLSFLFSANKGSEFKPLKKAVSGGELSRIMLTIKYVLSKHMQLPSIMFDEIDTGVSGEISNKMAHIMQQMSQHMQVFTITHLPQIAAKGDTHFKVYKETINNTTTTNLVVLNSDQRIVEIAQMLGGKEMSESAITHAKELLN